jgi:cytochrome d ubiquinol oxidase subunit II
LTPEPLVAAVLAAVLVVYVLTGGADFGGGVWDLLASGPRRSAQRAAIAEAIGPIWEANHVWLVLALVITFVSFPRAFALISTALHIPLLLLLLGVVLRGTAFVFRAYDHRDDLVQARWSAVFAGASVFCPVVLGIVVGALASGAVRVGELDLLGAWLRPFPFAVGFLNLAIVAFLAAVYLTLDTRGDPALQEDFRRRGLWAAGAVFVLAWLAFFLAREGAPYVWRGLWADRWAIPFQVAVAVCGLGCIASLWARAFVLARDLAAVQVALVVGGWAASQYPFVVPPDLTVSDAAPARVLWTLLAVMGVGAVPLLAAYAWLVWVFKSQDAG